MTGAVAGRTGAAHNINVKPFGSALSASPERGAERGSVRKREIGPPSEGARRIPGKEHAPMPTGTVKWFNATKGYGFIQPEDGTADVFVHISDVQRAGLNGLNEGQKVNYEPQRGNNGKVSAGNLRVS